MCSAYPPPMVDYKSPPPVNKPAPTEKEWLGLLHKVVQCECKYCHSTGIVGQNCNNCGAPINRT